MKHETTFANPLGSCHSGDQHTVSNRSHGALQQISVSIIEYQIKNLGLYALHTKLKYLNVGTKWLGEQGTHTFHLETLTSRKPMWLFLTYSFICSTSPLTSSPLPSPCPSLTSSSHFSVQFSRSVMYNTLQPHGLQYTRPHCPSPSPGVYPNSCQSSQ